MLGIRFLSTGTYLPAKRLTNADLEKMVDTSDEWITTRTGIKERRVAAAHEATSDLAYEAARQALETAGLKAADIDVIIVATTTADHSFPSTACLVQKRLGIAEAMSFDIAAACSGFIYGLACVKGLLETGAGKTALLVGVETLTRFVDWSDRGTCVLFGDGAGAIIARAEEGPSRLLSVYNGADPTIADSLIIPGGGSRYPCGPKGFFPGQPPYIRMNGKEIFKHAVTRMITSALKALDMAGKQPKDLALLIPHQANLRIIDAIAKRLDVDDARVFRNVQKYGNMSSATTIVALDEAIRAGQVKRGDLVELIAFGAGLTYGAAVIQW